jgi:hypothetical protein
LSPDPDAADRAPGPPPGRPVREPSLVDAVVPLLTLAVLIGGALLLFGLDALDGPIQVALVLCAMVAALEAAARVGVAPGSLTILGADGAITLVATSELRARGGGVTAT